ncbi:MAG: 5'/3'-nucleotidase SurE [bacterium]|nr:5'/3'-nucleotidase SurE [bacterium]
MKILLTNDDSLDSPLFRFAVTHFSNMGEVKVVVPTEEQSWKGKSMTRFGKLVAKPLPGFGCEAFGFTGTPADCANFGIYHVFDTKPDLVVSGVNMGSNVGLSFMISSGTVGAGLEANIAGLPAVALSQVLTSEAFQYWNDARKLSAELEAELFKQMAEMIDRVFGLLQSKKDWMAEPVTWNVNMPAEPVPDWQVVETTLGRTFYTSCFKPEGQVYQHNIDSPELDETPGSDGVVVRAGHVSVTRLDLRVMGQSTGEPKRP